MAAERVVAHALGLDDRVDTLTELVVRQADHGAGPHGGVGVEGGLDLGRVHVRAAGHDHVAAPVCEVEVALGVDPAEIAQRLPAVVGRPGLGTDVAVGRALAARRHHVHLADLAQREVVAVLVEDADLAVAGRLADGARVREPLRAGDERATDALGAAVHLEHALGTDPVDPGPEQPVRTGGTAGDDANQRGEVVALARGFGQTPDPLQHRRHEAHPGDAMSLDQRQRLLRIEARHQDHGAAEQQRGERVDEAGGVVLGPGNQHGGAGLVAVERNRGIDLRGQGVDDELRAPGAAAGGKGLARGRSLVRERGVRGTFGLGFAHDLRGGQLGVDARDDGGRGLLEDRVALLRREPPRDRLRHRPQLPGGEARHHEGRAVRETDADVIAEADATFREQAGQTIRAPIELAPRETLAVAHEGHSVGIGGGMQRERSRVGDDGHGSRSVGQPPLNRGRQPSAAPPARSRRG
jgi:hypothetical protein